MVKLDDAVIARYESEGHRFEILIDPEIIDDIKDEKDITITEYLASEEVFKDSKKGDRAGEETIEEVFNTTDIEEIAKIIVLKGQVQLTTEQRRKMTEVKRKQVITNIVQNAINPQTKAPHTAATIETAMNEAKIHIDPFKSTNMQVKEVLKAIKVLIPIKFEKIKIAIKVSGDNYGKIYGDIVGFGKLVQQEWLKDASWVGVVEIPAGLQNELIDIISKKTKGEIDIKLL